jgi:glycerol uptake facilitator-like aquaporin
MHPITDSASYIYITAQWWAYTAGPIIGGILGGAAYKAFKGMDQGAGME